MATMTGKDKKQIEKFFDQRFRGERASLDTNKDDVLPEASDRAWDLADAADRTTRFDQFMLIDMQVVALDWLDKN